jgi:3',5'-cyclic-AMP phosphodiesterase
VLLAHLSDTHLLAEPAARIGGHNPAENLSAVMHALPEQLDVMVVTGDVAENGNPRSYELAQSMTAGRADRTFFLPGNHDDPDAMRSVLGEVEDLRIIPLSDHWTMSLVNTQWLGHDAGRITDVTLARLRKELRRTTAHVVLCLHHPPISPCDNDDCGMVDGVRVADGLRDSPVRAVLSGHVHQQFDTVRHGIRFLGAPSTFRQLRHGGDPHYTDTGEPPAGHLLELRGDGGIDSHIVTAG